MDFEAMARALESGGSVLYNGRIVTSIEELETLLRESVERDSATAEDSTSDKSEIVRLREELHEAGLRIEDANAFNDRLKAQMEMRANDYAGREIAERKKFDDLKAENDALKTERDRLTAALAQALADAGAAAVDDLPAENPPVPIDPAPAAPDAPAPKPATKKGS